MEQEYKLKKEENTRLKEETEKLEKKIQKMKQNQKKKFELMNKYCNDMRIRFDFNQKLFSEKLNFDNSLILEVICLLYRKSIETLIFISQTRMRVICIMKIRMYLKTT